MEREVGGVGGWGGRREEDRNEWREERGSS